MTAVTRSIHIHKFILRKMNILIKSKIHCTMCVIKQFGFTYTTTTTATTTTTTTNVYR
jgi:hypothetical protein